MLGQVRGRLAVGEGADLQQQAGDACPPQFLADVKELGETMKVASKCGLGQTSPSAFLSILEGFEDEIRDRAPGA